MLQGTALGTMVSFLTYGNRKFAHLDEQMRRLLQPLYKAVREMTAFIDSDSVAFTQYMVGVVFLTHITSGHVGSHMPSEHTTLSRRSHG